MRAEALEGEWEGTYGVHIGRDRYRVIWEFDAEIRTVIVLAVGPKTLASGGTIYDRPRPGRESRWPEES